MHFVLFLLPDIQLYTRVIKHAISIKLISHCIVCVWISECRPSLRSSYVLIVVFLLRMILNSYSPQLKKNLDTELPS